MTQSEPEELSSHDPDPSRPRLPRWAVLVTSVGLIVAFGIGLIVGWRVLGSSDTKPSDPSASISGCDLFSAEVVGPCISGHSSTRDGQLRCEGPQESLDRAGPAGFGRGTGGPHRARPPRRSDLAPASGSHRARRGSARHVSRAPAALPAFALHRPEPPHSSSRLPRCGRTAPRLPRGLLRPRSIRLPQPYRRAVPTNPQCPAGGYVERPAAGPHRRSRPPPPARTPHQPDTTRPDCESRGTDNTARFQTIGLSGFAERPRERRATPCGNVPWGQANQRRKAIVESRDGQTLCDFGHIRPGTHEKGGVPSSSAEPFAPDCPSDDPTRYDPTRVSPRHQEGRSWQQES